MTQEIKVFTGSYRIALRDCVGNGFIPQTLSQVGRLLREGKLEKTGWYDTVTLWWCVEYDQRNATAQNIKDIITGKNLLVRPVCVSGLWSAALSYDYLDGDSGRLVGVKRQSRKKTTKVNLL